MKNTKIEFWYYVSVGAGLALSTSSFLLISGLFEVSNFVGVIMSCILAGLLCMAIASGVAEMAALYPAAPGIRTYLKQAIGNKFSLVLIYLYIFMLVLIAGAESHVFALVIHSIYPAINPIWIILLVFLFVIGINLRGMEFPRFLQMGMTLILLSGVLLMGIAGWIQNGSNTVTQDTSFATLASEGATQLTTLIGMAIFLFIGFEWVTPLGLKPDSYKKRIPLSMPIAILINVVIYSVFTAGIGVSMLPADIAQDTIPQMRYITLLGGDNMKYLAVFLSVLAILSTFNAGLLGGSRFIYALAREKKMPAFCAKISLSSGVTYGAICFLGGLSILSALVVNIYNLDLVCAIVSSAIICIVYGALLVSVPKLRTKFPKKKRSFKTKLPLALFWGLGVVMPLLGIATLFTIPELSLLSVVVLLVSVLLAVLLVYIPESTNSNSVKPKVKTKN